jgi:hypothetical protein
VESDFAIVHLSSDLAAALGVERRVLVEALEMTGGAVFRGLYSRWKQRGRTFMPEQAITVPDEHHAALEELFVAARRLRPTDDAATVREADYQHAKARVYGRVDHARNPGGYKRTGGYR